MTLIKLIKAIFLPITELTVLFPLIMFWLLVSIGTSGSPLGLLVLILCLPPLFRYQMIILEASARGVVPGAFDAEFFDWSGSMWTLFPLPIAIALIFVGISANEAFGNTGVIVVLAIACGLLPASFAVLAITHSPLQSLNPIAIGRLLRSAGETFWIASVYLFAVGWAAVQAEQLPNIASNFIQLYALFSFAAVNGALIEPLGLIDDVSIPDSLEATEDEKLRFLESDRNEVLTHAYGFISRGNRDGGFKHIMKHLAEDPDEVAAWSWFFERMMNWSQKEHALFFAQHYIHDLLLHGDKIPALKVIMRCRFFDERFKPFKEDLPAAIAAAERSSNIELAAVLKRY